MGIDLLDIFFRLERVFGVKLTRQDVMKLWKQNADRDILVGDLFELVRRTTCQNGLIDEEIDGEEKLWRLFQEVLSEATGIDVEKITRDQGLIQLGIV